MGLITGLLTLPLAPVRATAWLAEQIMEQAEQEMDEGAAIRESLDALQAARETGEFSDDEIEAAENELIERLLAVRGLAEESSSDGELE
jgi:hypothetical protein